MNLTIFLLVCLTLFKFYFILSLHFFVLFKEFVTDPNVPYRWFSMRWSTLVFHIKATTSAQIILSNRNEIEGTNNLEIHIGMDRNYYTHIYHNQTEVWREQTANILNPSDFVSFVISWRFNVLSIYQQGYQLPLAMYTIKHESPFALNFFGIRSEQ